MNLLCHEDNIWIIIFCITHDTPTKANTKDHKPLNIEQWSMRCPTVPPLCLLMQYWSKIPMCCFCKLSTSYSVLLSIWKNPLCMALWLPNISLAIVPTPIKQSCDNQATTNIALNPYMSGLAHGVLRMVVPLCCS